MFKFLDQLARKRTQTASSAFFCGRAFLLGSALAALVLILFSAHVLASDGRKPEVHLDGFSVDRVDWNKRIAETKLTVAIDNPGPAFKLKDLSYRLKLNDKQAAEGKYDRDISVVAESRTIVELPCSVELSALPGVAWGIVSRGFDVRYELETEFTIPIFPTLSPKVKTSFGGELSLVETVSGWTAKIKERVSKE